MSTTATLTQTSSKGDRLQAGSRAAEGAVMASRPASPSKMVPGSRQSTVAVNVNGSLPGRNVDDGVDSDNDEDRGEGTSADGPGLMAKLSRNIGQDHPDVASLLKDPLIFVTARFPDEANQSVPYEPLPSGPSIQHMPNTKGVKATMNGKDATSSSAAAGDDSTASQSASSPSKGKGPLANGLFSQPSSVPLPMNWPQSYPVGPGYHNLGNTCFLNSTLQALTHTAPLVACLMGDAQHSRSTCKISANDRFCILCAMQRHVRGCFAKGRSASAIQPSSIVNNLRLIAKHMRVGRQEDAHEFLRFGLDQMLEAAAKNITPPAKTDEEKDHTFIKRIFGGKLRSRVTCGSCSHDSDTFDGFMDISLDVSKADNVKEALQAFVRTDLLQGANKYRCEKCKKLVNARKQFTIHQAPQILHVHLKRFTPTGKKIGGSIGYPETLHLGDYMSEGSLDRNPTYRLYAVVCHSGSGPHSGHYFAHVRSGANRWHCMNDSSVSDVQPQNALSQRNAYLLFYERCNRLGDAVGKFKLPGGSTAPQLPGAQPSPTTNGFSLGKRKERDDDAGKTGSPFDPQRVKLHQSGSSPAIKTSQPVHQQQRQAYSSPFKQSNGSSSPNRSMGAFGHKKQKHSGPPIRTTNFFSQNGNKQGNRPRLVDAMGGRPRN